MSRIRETLADKTLLLTGVTGFFAKALLAKLLADVPEVRRIYVLIRPGASSRDPAASVEGRLRREVLDSSAFAPLRQRYREAFGVHAAGKVIPVAGDLSQERFGCDAATVDRLAAELDLIVNSAASVSFDESLDEALELNTLGPSRLLGLAKAAGGIPLVQVSTAYVCGDRDGLVPEEPPQVGLTPAARRTGGPPLDLDRLLDALTRACAELRREGDPEAVRRALVAEGLRRARALGWHDVYTMTKSLGEQLLVRDRGNVPLCLLRPSIIESALREPQPGWLDGLRMADPMIVAFGRGQIRDFPGVPSLGLDIVPVDLVVNATVAAAGELLRAGGFSVYHAATGDVAPLTVGDFSDAMYEYFARHPLRDRHGRPVRVAPWRFPPPRVFERRYRARRLAPLKAVRRAVAAPGLTPLRSALEAATTSRIAALEQMLYLADLYGPYTRMACTFDTRRLRALEAALDAEDQARFPFDATAIVWRDYVQDVHIPGLKHFVLRLPDVPGAGQAKADGLRAAPAADPADPAAEVRTLRDLLRGGAARFREAPALEVKQGERHIQYSYEEVARLASLVGERLLAHGLSAGDRVGLLAENRPEWGIAYLGAVTQGIVVVPLDPQLPEAELEDLLRRTGARALLCAETLVRELSDDALRRLADPALGVALLDVLRFGCPFPGLDPPPRPRGIGRPPGPDDLASILFTSGTTVAPKGVMLTHANFLANVRAVTEFLGATAEDRVLSVLPLHHAFEFTCGFLGALWVGARVIYLPSVNSAQILAAMRERGITMLLGVPRLYQLLAQGIEDRLAAAGPGARRAVRALAGLGAVSGMRARRALHWHVHRAFGGRLRLLVSGGASLDPEVFDRFRALGFTLCEGYGLTEAAPVVTVNPPARPQRGSVGIPLPTVELRIETPDPDGVGEIVVRGPNVMRGYFGQPDLTAAALRDGWLHTGDLGRRGADGYLYITGRLKDVIVTAAGLTLSPEDVEGLYKDLPGVRESCVVGMPGPGGAGEEVHLAVVAEGGAGVDRAGILRAIDVRSQAAPSHRRVQRVHFLPGELPKTATLKVKRGDLRRLLQAAAGGGATAPGDGGGGSAGASPAEQAMLALLARLVGMPPSRLPPQAHLERDLGFDSLMRVELLAYLDSQRGRPLSEAWAARLQTVEDLLALARREGAKPSARAGATGPTWRQLLERPGGGPRAAEPVPRPGMFGVAVGAARVLLGRYCGMACEGLEHLPPKGPFLLAANHASHLDTLAVLAALGERAEEIALVGARDYFFDRAWKRAILPRALPIIPFDREGDFLEGLRLCREAIGMGRSLLIFPEGTRTRTGALQPFKAGVGVLAVELGLPIVPTAIEGTFAALPVGRALPRRRPVRVTFGPPILPGRAGEGDGDGDDRTPYARYRDVVDRVRAAIAGLLGRRPESRVPGPVTKTRDP
jgi:long-chain acyl-CoA synthetase